MLDSDVCRVYSLHYGGPKFKSELSVPLLKAANSWLLSYLLLSQTPQTIINTTFCQMQPSAMVCVLLTIHSHVQSILPLQPSPILLPVFFMSLFVHGEHSASQPETGPLVKY